MNESGGVLTVREAARRCGKAEETVRRWIWSGRLPARKLGNQYFIDEGELAKLAGGVAEASAAYAAGPAPDGTVQPRGGKERPAVDYEFRGMLDDLREHRGQAGVTREDAIRYIEEDEAFAKRLADAYGKADVVGLVRKIRGE